jgi:hypothetical protein
MKYARIGSPAITYRQQVPLGNRKTGKEFMVERTIQRDSPTSCSDIEKPEDGSCISGRAVIEVPCAKLLET